MVRRARHRYAAEVTGEPYEAFAPGSIEPPPEVFIQMARNEDAEEALLERGGRIAGEAITLVSVGSIEISYKGFDVLIQAFRKCIEKGLNLRLVLIGGGRSRARLAEARSIRVRVCFTEELPGLPRPMIEAMAVAQPCLGLRIGGSPELLVAENTFMPA